MVFKSYSFWVSARILMVIGLVSIFFSLRAVDGFSVSSWVCLGLAILVACELVFFVNRYNRQLVTLVESLVNSDFNLRFANSYSGKFPSEFSGMLSLISMRFQEIKIEEEARFKLLQHIVDDISFAVLCLNSQGKVILFNAAAGRMLGYGSCTNLSSIGKYHPSLHAAITNIDRDVIQIVRDDTVLVLSFTCKQLLLFGEEHKLITLSNIKPLIDKQEQESWKKVIRVLTHEIMNSVAPIASLSQSFSSYASRNSSNPITISEQSEMVEGYRIIGSRTASLMHFVEQFRRLTKIPAPVKEMVSLSDLITGISRLVVEKLELDEIRLIVNYQEGSCNMDKGQIEQVLLNLITNSAEALVSTGSKTIELTGFFEEANLYLKVADNGIGILAENIDQVFIPFFTTKASGSGIGLSLVREIIWQHGGDISVRSKQGEGTFIIVRIPIN